MATIQAKVSRGCKYWYIVESKRVNGKPRPVVLMYLGKPADLLRRLQHGPDAFRIKSFSHGAVAALLSVARQLDVPSVINKYVKSGRDYVAEKPLRNGLTVGATLLFGAIGRICHPTSKRGWATWAEDTSLEYLLRTRLRDIDSQHFWDLMDALPEKSIHKAEKDLLDRVKAVYGIEGDTILYDTTNFFTYIATTNTRCTVAQRGKNKQKRADLRQVGLALVVSKQDMVPLFHRTYRGNMHDAKLFPGVIRNIKKRLLALDLDLERHTIVFDQGSNSKKNLLLVDTLDLHYVGCLSPCQHEELIREAAAELDPVEVGDMEVDAYRTKRTIWKRERTVVIFISEKLKEGQFREVEQLLLKAKGCLREMSALLKTPEGKLLSRQAILDHIHECIPPDSIRGILQWSITGTPGDYGLTFSIDEKRKAEVEDSFGYRIIMTDRHGWSTEEIVSAYHNQSTIEHVFKNMKNPFHLAVRPQYHWTDQKIAVHYFMCVLGFLLATLVWKSARQKAHFAGSLHSLLDRLNNIRLSSIIENSGRRGAPKVSYTLEDMSAEDASLLRLLGLSDFHVERPPLAGVGVYE